MSDPYIPIDCNFYDELTVIVLSGRPVDIEFDGESGHERMRDRIVDVVTRGPEEYLITGGGREIRLDRLVEVDGKALPSRC